MQTEVTPKFLTLSEVFGFHEDLIHAFGGRAGLRDLALLVPPQTRVEEVLNVIEVAGGLLVTDVDLFDIYEGEGIVRGLKNLAFHIIYQSEDRTLTSIEVYKIHQKIIKALEENPTWQVRK